MKEKRMIDDDDLFSTILNRLPYIDEEVLLKVKNELIENNEDMEVIDEIIENNKLKSTEEKQMNITNNKKSNINFFQLLNIFKKNDKVQKNTKDYENYQLEEQELEEDDFHYDDLD